MSKQRGVLLNRDMVIASLTCAKCGKLSRPFPCEHCGSTEFLKQQTRRIIKPQPDHFHRDIIGKPKPWKKEDYQRLVPQVGEKEITPKLGTAGDFLYCRETARLLSEDIETGYSVFSYEADSTIKEMESIPSRIKHIQMGHCCSNGCFKELASIWFKITGVRAERVRDISGEEIMKEGVVDPNADNQIIGGMRIHDKYVIRDLFEKLWNSCYPGSWERNDWVFVYDVQRTEKP